jgi:signal transduction histidine kinase/ActR/RegA family two-component response regulator
MVATPGVRAEATNDALGAFAQLAALGDRLGGVIDEKALAEICLTAGARLVGAQAMAYLSDQVCRAHATVGRPPAWDDDTLAVLRSTALQAIAVGGRAGALAAEAIPPGLLTTLAPGQTVIAAPLRHQRELVGVLVAVVAPPSPGPGPGPHALPVLASLAQLASGCLGGMMLTERAREHTRELEVQLEKRGREVRLLEARLISSDRMATIGMLAAGIGHEIANPLATVMLNNGALNNRLARAGLPAGLLTESQRLLAENDEALDRIRGIVSELRTFARRDDDSMQPLDLRAVVESSLRLCRAQLRGVDVKVELPALPVVSGSSSRLAQVLLNLLVNAAQALGGMDKPRIVVGAELAPDEVHVTVADSGPGVPEDVRERIWDIFFTTKGPGVGTGLGLAIARDIAARHGGRLELGVSPLGGAMFRLVLPRRAGATADEARPKTPSSPSIKPARRKPSAPSLPAMLDAIAPRPRLLIVDDEVMILRALERELGSDFEVVTALSGDEAVRHAEARRVDAVLCDLNLVAETGLDVTKRLAGLDAGVLARTVFMSGAPLTTRLRQQLQSTPSRFVSKPFDMTALTRLLREISQTAG